MPGLGTTVDCVLVNGMLREGDKIVVCGLNGAVVTRIKALKTPQVCGCISECVRRCAPCFSYVYECVVCVVSTGPCDEHLSPEDATGVWVDRKSVV